MGRSPRTSGAGRRFELVVIRLDPPTPRTAGVIAKHASSETYHWMLLTGRHHAEPDNLARLLAVAYLDEASGMLGRGDPRWAVPRAYLRTTGEMDTEDRPRWDDEGLPHFVRTELERIAAWLRRANHAYLDALQGAVRGPEPPDGFERLSPDNARRWGFADPTGRALLAPPPPPVVTRTTRADAELDPADRLPWRRYRISRG